MRIGGFIDPIKGQIDKGIYVWGADGELLSTIDPAWIKKKENSTSNYEKALAMYEKRKGIKDARAFDCSGLVCWGLRQSGAKPSGFDKTAEGLRQMCTKISKSELKDGDLCFKVSDGKAHHVGVYIGGKIVEAKGRAYGVVSSSVTSSWDAFGRLNIKWDAEPTPTPSKFVLTRVLRKGDKGNDVKEVQKLLLANGERLKKFGADGSFGIETLNAVRSFQRKHESKPYYLKVDGAVGKNTITALGGTWGGK